MGLSNLNSGSEINISDIQSSINYCWNCGNELGITDKFCGKCGIRLDDKVEGDVPDTKQPTTNQTSFTISDFCILVILGTLFWIILAAITVWKFIKGDKDVMYYILATFISFFTALILVALISI